MTKPPTKTPSVEVDPYDEGYQASKDNKPHYDSNPYALGTREWKRWSTGYFSYWFHDGGIRG